jgi:hypothetical protein
MYCRADEHLVYTYIYVFTHVRGTLKYSPSHSFVPNRSNSGLSSDMDFTLCLLSFPPPTPTHPLCPPPRIILMGGGGGGGGGGVMLLFSF